jgi:hypothetical protein
MGARVRVTPMLPGGRLWVGRTLAQSDAPVIIDIRHDRHGEYFDVFHRSDVSLDVIDVEPSDRHLLLMAREPRDNRGRQAKSKFLCGHDERSWFVAAIPENAGAKDVQSAMDALKPRQVWASIFKSRTRLDRRNRRRTEAFVRQGEWFFLPRPKLVVDEKLVLPNEPITRGGGKPHMCQLLYRRGGERVYVSPLFPNGASELQYSQLSREDKKRYTWRVMVRDARVFVKGAIRHPDHATVRLPFWHEVVMNTETKARAMRHVAFLD